MHWLRLNLIEIGNRLWSCFADGLALASTSNLKRVKASTSKLRRLRLLDTLASAHVCLKLAWFCTQKVMKLFCRFNWTYYIKLIPYMSASYKQHFTTKIASIFLKITWFCTNKKLRNYSAGAAAAALCCSAGAAEHSPYAA